MNVVLLKIKDINQTPQQDVLKSNIRVNFPLCPEGQIGYLIKSQNIFSLIVVQENTLCGREGASSNLQFLIGGLSISTVCFMEPCRNYFQSLLAYSLSDPLHSVSQLNYSKDTSFPAYIIFKLDLLCPGINMSVLDSHIIQSG